jgi:hypothetical protein
MHPELRKFLWERNIWWRFVLNTILYCRNFKGYCYIKSMLNKPESSSIIVAFDWYSTNEGHAFWQFFSRKWEEYIYKSNQ